MRLVRKDLTDIPPALNNVNVSNDLEKIAHGDKTLINPKIYKGEYKDAARKTQSQVREYLNKYYHSKCAYCELHCKAEIEHYRPKLQVEGDNTHPGYYWLCYAWSNLVPSCRYCNTEGGKGNKFPIINIANRVRLPEFVKSKLNLTKCNAQLSPLKDEKAYLLHPEIDDPKDFFCFKISDDKNGVDICGKDGLKRGETTISICNLNRNYVKLSRLETVYYNIKQQINLVFILMADGTINSSDIGKALKIVFKQIHEDSQNEKLTHTLLRWFIIENEKNFAEYFVPYLDNEQQRIIVITAFKNFKKGIL